MIIYLLLDEDPDGGYYAAQDRKPDMRIERRSIVEVREVDVLDSLWEMTLRGELPVDADHSNDSTWVDYWPQGKTVWSRSGTV